MVENYLDLFSRSSRSFLVKLQSDMVEVDRRLSFIEEAFEKQIGKLLAEYEHLSVHVSGKVYGFEPLRCWKWTAQDDLMTTQNLYDLEETADGKKFRWTGPDPATKISLLLDRREDYRIAVVVNAYSSSEIEEETKLIVDNEVVPATRRNEMLIGVIPKRKVMTSLDPTEVVISSGRTVRPVDEGISSDTRYLGIALRSIDIEQMRTDEDNDEEEMEK